MKERGPDRYNHHTTRLCPRVAEDEEELDTEERLKSKLESA